MLNKLYSYFFNKANTLRSQISKKEGESPWRVKTFAALYLFAIEIMEDLLKLLILLFKNPYDSFQLFTKQETLPICEYSYSDHKRFKKKVQLFSAAGISSIVAIALIINIILSLVVPGQLPSYAKTVNGGWDDWSLTNLAGDPPSGSAGSIAISPADSAEISGTGTASDLRLKSTSYTATDDGSFTTTGNATGGGFVPAKLLLHADGTDASPTFTDETEKTVTVYGNAQIDTAQSVFGGASGLFDGTGDYLTIPDSDDWNFTDGDYTIDFRVKFNSLAPVAIGLGGNLYNSANTAMYVYGDASTVNPPGSVAIGIAGTNQIITAGGVVTTGIWYHIAYVRTGSTTKIFVDGVEKASSAIAVWTNSSNPLTFGGYTYNSVFYGLNGWMDEIRVSKGIARWTSNFTPPTSAYIDDSTFSSTAVTGSGAGASVGLAQSTGLLTALSPATIAAGTNPDDVTISPDGASAYVTNYGSGTVSMFSRNTSTGLLTALSPATTAVGTNPRGVTISPDGAFIYVTNYGSGTVSMFSRNTSTGLLTALSPATIAAGGTSPNNIVISADGAFAYVTTATASGNVSMFSRNTSTGLLTALSPATIATGGGVSNSIVISQDGTSVYVTDDYYSKLFMFSRNTSTGLLTALSPTFIAVQGRSADLAISQDGKSVYVTDNFFSGFSMVSRNTSTGLLTNLGTIAVGTTPEDVTISPDGAFVYVTNFGSGTVSMYSRNTSTSLLTALGTIAAGTNPRGVTISPDGASAYVTNYGSGTVSMYSRDTNKSSGTFESATIDLGGKGSLGNLNFSSTATQSSIGTWAQTADADFTGTNSSTMVSGGSVGLEQTAYTKLLIHADGTDASTTFTDETGKTMTRYGNAQIDTAQSKFGGASGLFDGTGDYLKTPIASNVDFNFQTSPFTVETWARFNSLGGPQAFFSGYAAPTTSWGLFHNGTRLQLNLSDNGSDWGLLNGGLGAKTDFAINTWYHIEFSWDGSTYRVFVDGVLDYSLTSSTGIKSDVGMNIGTWTSPTDFNFNGWMDEIRVSKGIARHTANFTPPTSAYGYGYASPGTYTSSIKPVGPGAGFGTMSWSATTNGQTLTMKVRSCNDSACSGETSFSSLPNVTNGADISALTGVSDSDGYVQYQATLTTTDTTVTPTLDSVSINITPLALQVATSDSSTGPWTYYGPDGATGTYFTSSGTAIPSALSGKQYFRYKAYLATADTAYTPTLDSATLNYTQYPSSSTVTNLKFNSGYTGLIWTSVSWAISNPSDISSSVKVKTQARVAANDTALGSATFAGYDGTNTNDSTYFDFYGSGQTNCSSAEGKFGDGDATKKTYTCQINQSDTTYLNKADPDRTWLELKLVLESDNYRAPQIDAARATFAINNEPEICVKLTDDTTCDTSVTTLKKIVEPSPFSYLSVAQDQSDQYGNVIFDSYLRDPDTNTGAVENQGFLYVGIEYTDSSGAFGNATDSVIPPVSPATGYYDGTGAAGKGRFATGANITITPKESGFANCELTGWTDYRAGFRYKCPVYTSTPNKYARYTFKWKIGRYDENGTFSGDVQDLALANNFKIRLVTYDGEGANSVNGSARAVSNGFTVDTKKPAVTVNSTIINAAPAASGSGTIGWLPSATDDNTMQYKLSDDGATWPASWSNYSATILHDFAESTDRTTTLYYRLKDAYGNETAPASVTSLQRPHNLTLIDVSNVKGEDTSKYSYANFISWNLVENPLNKFNSYIVYRCIRTNTDTANYCDEKTNYSIINSGQNTALSTNSFTDYLSSADTEKLVYYRVASKDNNGNISGWLAGGTTTSSVYGQANGRLDYGEGGGGGDGEPPKILVAPSFSNIAQTSANVIWTTDELATGGVFYSKNSTNYNSEKSTLAYQTTGYDATTSPSGRTIALTGLDASSIYNIRLKSVDASGNITICDAVTTASQATDSVTGAVTYINQTGYCPSGATADTYRFTTLEKDVTPPVISAVTISEVDHESAKIVWTTNENSDSCVSFDTADTDRTYGSGQCASGQITSHTVTLAGLTASMTYYVKVKSQDVEKNLADKCSLEDNTDCPTITLANANYAFTTTAAPPPEVVVISSGGGGGARGKQDFTAPVISGITVADITDQSATVAWTTDEKSSSFVQYGESENLLNTTGGQLDEVLSHKVVLKGLKPETKYFFKATSVDWAGNIGSSNILNFATEKAPTVEEEISQISGIEAQEKTKEVLEKLEEQIKAQKENIVDPLQTLLDALSPFVNEPIIIGESPEIEVNSTTATIKWRTDKKSTSFVALAREDEFDDKAAEPYKMVVGNPEDSVKEHKVEITGLLPATKYHYQVRSKALIGEMSKSKDFTFTTKSELPQIVSFLQKKTDNEKTAVIYWETSVPTDSVVKYTPYVEGKLDAKQSQIQGKPDMATSHEITLTNLDPGTIYQIEVSGKDPFANATAKTLPDFTTAIDKDAPVISQVRIESAMISGKTPKIQTIVSFRTDEPATSQVSFVEGGQEKFKQLPANLALSTTHTFVITDFKPASIYRIRVEATDESGNLAVSRDFTILTPAQSQSIIDIIVKTFENTFGWVKNVRF